LDSQLKATLINRLLLLYLIDDAKQYKPIPITKTHKLAYLAQKEMNKKSEKGFSYYFKKLSKGPFSDGIGRDVDWLEEAQLLGAEVYEDHEFFYATQHGHTVLTDFKEMFERNKSFTSIINAVNHKYAHYNSQQLVRLVHGQKNPVQPKITIHETLHGEAILFYLNDEVAKKKFDITEEEEESLDIYLDKQSYDSAVAARISAQTEPFLELCDVF